jgi:hypothetical protein
VKRVAGSWWWSKILEGGQRSSKEANVDTLPAFTLTDIRAEPVTDHDVAQSAPALLILLRGLG